MSPVSHDQEALGLIDRWTAGQARTLYLARKDTYLEEDKYELLDENGSMLLRVDKHETEGNVYTGNDGSQYLHTSTGLFTRKSIITLSSNKQKEVGWAELDFQGGCRYILRFLDTYSHQEKFLGTKGKWSTDVELLVDDRVIALVHAGEERSSDSGTEKTCFQRKIDLKANVDPALVFVAIVLFEQMGGNREFSPRHE